MTEIPHQGSDTPARSLDPRRWLWVGGGVVGGLVLLYLLLLLLAGGGIPKGTTVDGVDIGGLDEAAAVSRPRVLLRAVRGMADLMSAPWV